MITYTNAKTLYQKLTADNSTTNTTIFDLIYNGHNRHILSSYDWPFLERSQTDLTEASTQFYPLPFNAKKNINVTITVGSTKYSPLEAPNKKFWDRLNSPTTQTSDIPQYYYIFDGQIGFYPTPSSAGNTITINSKVRVKDLSIADYTTGTITTATNGSTAIVGDSTVWTSKMAGRWIRITDSNDANTGDGEWYEIASVTDNTNLVLVNEYEGTSIVAGSASYTIGQVSEIPEDYQTIPVYYSVADYWRKEDQNRADRYEAKGNDLLDAMKREFGAKSEDPTMDISEVNIKNPNLYLNQ